MKYLQLGEKKDAKKNEKKCSNICSKICTIQISFIPLQRETKKNNNLTTER